MEALGTAKEAALKLKELTYIHENVGSFATVALPYPGSRPPRIITLPHNPRLCVAGGGGKGKVD